MHPDARRKDNSEKFGWRGCIKTEPICSSKLSPKKKTPAKARKAHSVTQVGQNREEIQEAPSFQRPVPTNIRWKEARKNEGCQEKRSCDREKSSSSSHRRNFDMSAAIRS